MLGTIRGHPAGQLDNTARVEAAEEGQPSSSAFIEHVHQEFPFLIGHRPTTLLPPFLSCRHDTLPAISSIVSKKRVLEQKASVDPAFERLGQVKRSPQREELPPTSSW